MDTAKENALSFADRCRGAIWGQFVGDAACLAEGKQPGEPSHYGDAALLMLQSVAELGYFSAPDFGPRFIAHFSSEEYSGYLDQTTRGTITNYRDFCERRPGASYHFQGGANDDRPATLTRLAPVIVNRCLQDSLVKVVENATRVCQDNQRAVVYAKCHALITKELLTGNNLENAVKSAAVVVANDGEMGKEIASSTEAVFGMLNREVREAALHFGSDSPLRNCFPAALHCALKHQDDIREAITKTANAGGDSAARAAMIGTWLGALHGIQAIPEDLRDQLKARDEILRCVESLLAGVK